MLWWTAYMLYIFGWVASIRPTLRRHMRANACPRCRLYTYHHEQHTWLPRGAISDRNKKDALRAVWLAAWWPIYLLVWVVLIPVMRVVVHGLLEWVLGGKLTMVEMERHEKERTKDIVKDTAALDVIEDSYVPHKNGIPHYPSSIRR